MKNLKIGNDHGTERFASKESSSNEYSPQREPFKQNDSN
jgi:hypothetical protein